MEFHIRIMYGSVFKYEYCLEYIFFLVIVFFRYASVNMKYECVFVSKFIEIGYHVSKNLIDEKRTSFKSFNVFR